MKKTHNPPPAWLDDLAKSYWPQFTDSVNLKDRYLYETLAHYCGYLSEYRQACDLLKEGIVIGDKLKRQHPAVVIKNQAMAHLMRLAKILFSPIKDNGTTEADELTNFFGGK